MRFIPAKCPNCSAKIKMVKGQSIYKCEFCDYDIIFDDSGKFDTSKMNTEGINPSKFNDNANKVVTIVAGLIILLVTISIGVSVHNMFNKNNVHSYEESISEHHKKSEEFKKNNDMQMFNSSLELNGFEMGYTVGKILNDLPSKMDQYDRKVIVTYKGTEMSNNEDIYNLAKTIEATEFERVDIRTYKDSEGFINRIEIK